MIFVTLGSQKFQFNRLLKELDKLVEQGLIKEDIFAQTGYSDYIPKNYKFKNFLDRDEFSKVMNECDKVITHGGTGAIIGAVKKNKKVIAVPRNKKFNEHVDNHQYDIVDAFSRMKIIEGVFTVEQLGETISSLEFTKLSNYVSNTEVLVKDIKRFLKQI
ncbi:beta(1,3)galactosyltransferase EpsH [Clostridium perfringens]